MRVFKWSCSIFARHATLAPREAAGPMRSESPDISMLWPSRGGDGGGYDEDLGSRFWSIGRGNRLYAGHREP